MVTAHIRWFRADEGGLLHPPAGPRYSTVAWFEEQTEEQWKKDAWSLVIEFSDQPDESGHQVVAVRFLSEKGPTKWLKPSSKFCLYEGDKKTVEQELDG
jgi:hypothetical protein